MIRRLLLFCAVGLISTGCTTVVAERLESAKTVDDGTGYIFIYDDMSATDVYLAGEMNRWGPNDGGKIRKGDKYNIKFKRREDGIWQAVVPYKEHVKLPQYDTLDDEVYVEHGNRYRYKIVIDGDRWIADPNNRSILRDPDGNENSLLVAP
ncbi:MAG: hypothetical protein AAB229_06215 [Candidatus Hydrogenedentota bacterium]